MVDPNLYSFSFQHQITPYIQIPLWSIPTWMWPGSVTMKQSIQIPLWSIPTRARAEEKNTRSGFRFLYGRSQPVKGLWGLWAGLLNSDSSMVDPNESYMMPSTGAKTIFRFLYGRSQLPAVCRYCQEQRIQIPLWSIPTELPGAGVQVRWIFRFLYGRSQLTESPCSVPWKCSFRFLYGRSQHFVYYFSWHIFSYSDSSMVDPNQSWRCAGEEKGIKFRFLYGRSQRFQNAPTFFPYTHSDSSMVDPNFACKGCRADKYLGIQIPLWSIPTYRELPS